MGRFIKICGYIQHLISLLSSGEREKRDADDREADKEGENRKWNLIRSQVLSVCSYFYITEKMETVTILMNNTHAYG